MRPSVAIGPITREPSWEWVGADTSAELRKYFEVVMFSSKHIPTANVIMFIKCFPPRDTVLRLKAAGCKLIYVPIDYFRDNAHIVETAWFMEMCDMIITHAESLTMRFRSFGPVEYVDHHGKFFLPRLSPYKQSGFCLWVGALANVPYLLYYLSEHPIKLDTILLTDINNVRARQRATEVAKTLGITMHEEKDRLNGLRVCPWSASLQTEMLQAAKAAIDIKGNDFNQAHKPPTKAQKYICSGVPLAMNDCEIVRYLQNGGLRIPLPTDDRWLTEEYYAEVAASANRWRPTLSLEAIGLRFKEVIEKVLRERDG
jgi:hypothetical protein